jgi:hypothetical protein
MLEAKYEIRHCTEIPGTVENIPKPQAKFEMFAVSYIAWVLYTMIDLISKM